MQLAIVVLTAVCVGYVRAASLQVVDLTHTFGPDTLYWPGNPRYNFTILHRGQSGGHWYESNAYSTAEHGGTHLDSPAHFAEDAIRTHDIPVEKLTGHGVIINVTNKAAGNPDYRVQVSDLQAWEQRNGEIPDGAIVIMNSGWHYKYPNATLTFNTDQPDTPSTFHFPAWHEDTVEWLVTNRNIHCLGVDTPSTDYGQSSTFPVHVILGTNNIPGLENVANLDAIPESGSVINVGVLKIYDGSGGQARIIATLNPDTTTSAVAMNKMSSIVLGCMVMVVGFVLCSVFK